MMKNGAVQLDICLLQKGLSDAITTNTRDIMVLAGIPTWCLTLNHSTPGVGAIINWGIWVYWMLRVMIGLKDETRVIIICNDIIYFGI